MSVGGRVGGPRMTIVSSVSIAVRPSHRSIRSQAQPTGRDRSANGAAATCSAATRTSNCLGTRPPPPAAADDLLLPLTPPPPPFLRALMALRARAATGGAFPGAMVAPGSSGPACGMVGRCWREIWAVLSCRAGAGASWVGMASVADETRPPAAARGVSPPESPISRTRCLGLGLMGLGRGRSARWGVHEARPLTLLAPFTPAHRRNPAARTTDSRARRLPERIHVAIFNQGTMGGGGWKNEGELDGMTKFWMEIMTKVRKSCVVKQSRLRGWDWGRWC